MSLWSQRCSYAPVRFRYNNRSSRVRKHNCVCFSEDDLTSFEKLLISVAIKAVSCPQFTLKLSGSLVLSHVILGMKIWTEESLRSSESSF